MLAVRDAEAAIRFYQVAFGAELLWRLGDHRRKNPKVSDTACS
jgi:uncharacterized glyoxalase superfamily protein PhnB